jgi:hypothetical protein
MYNQLMTPPTLLDYFITGYIVSQVDGRAWNSEAAGSKPATRTKIQIDAEYDEMISSHLFRVEASVQT